MILLARGGFMRKKKWSTPLLTVLVRGKPEERALSGCKHYTAGGGPESNVEICRTISPCVVCSDQAPS